MEDQDVMDHIEELVAEEKELRSRHDDGLDGDEQARLSKLEVDLDRYWDMLRQRRSMRETGGDPKDAELRDSYTVEHYKN